MIFKETQKRKKGKYNNRIIRWMLLIVIMICAAVILGYGFITYQDAVNRSEEALSNYLKNEEYDPYGYSGDLPFVFEMPVLSYPTDSFYDSEEYDLNEYYLTHKDELEYGRIYQLNKLSTGSHLVFMPLKDCVYETEYMIQYPDREAVIIYCTISYTVEILLNNMLVFSAVIAGVLILLFIVSRFAVSRLNKKDEEMKNFFANASHELKTPLMSIRGNVDGMRNSYVEPEQGYDVIEKEVDRMSELITGILDISRLDSGSIQPEMLDTDIREIIYDTVGSFLPKAQKQGIRIEMDLPDPIFRACDEAMLHSAFSNIIGNALRYADSRIRIRSVQDPDHMNKVTLCFENDGSVISSEDSKHIFERFYKGSKGQTGIGMALAQEYIRLHGSEITVGVEDAHTVFKISI